jgi:uncharacterized protein YbjT (DUF2867 family)
MQGLVTVFGGSGFVGAQVVRALAKRGLRVRIAVRRPGVAYRVRTLGDVGQIEVVQANLRNPASIGRALDGAEACINLVGVLYEQGRQRFQTLHAKGAEEVASACVARGITNFVQMSALGADPDSASRYGRTKGLGEQAVRSLIPSAVVIRPSVVFGVDDSLFNRFATLASSVAGLLGALAELPTRLLPMAPVLTADQVEMLKSDAVPAPGMPGLKALGVDAPVAVEAILPTYMYRFRRGGQFAVDPQIASPTGI